MTAEVPLQQTIYGYLSTLESAEHGFFGGYLLVSSWGRPLEFHCTAPVRPSRAQQILYGSTLRPYLLGEQIGGTLLAQAKLRPRVVLTDQLAAICLRSQAGVPMALMCGAEHEQDRGVTDPGGRLSSRRFLVGDHQWELPRGFEEDRNSAIELLTLLSEHVDLPEPFRRIHEAIREAQRIGEGFQDANGEAA